ncbi:unnamed protein product, partial [Echinostoma caproni]|uniref:RPAP3_C domain-containing protein n=1 Tax=Echinostoma caproni TaxID=27848 RepID=A0A183B5V6_9TREM
WRRADVPGGVRGRRRAGGNSVGPGSVDDPPSASQGPSAGSVGCGAKRPGGDGMGAAKDAPIAGFDNPADRQQALRSFRTAQLGVAVAPLSHIVALLNRALRPLEDAACTDLLLDGFTESRPKDLRETAWIINAEKIIDASKLADVLRKFT